VPEMVSVTLRFPGERLAQFSCGFGEAKVSDWRLVGTKGDIRMDPGYSFSGERKQFVTIDGKTKEKTFPTSDQVGPEIVYFSDCILSQRDPEPSGVEGLIDVHILEAVEHSISTGRPVPIAPVAKKKRPAGHQVKEAPPVENPELVNAASPSGS